MRPQKSQAALTSVRAPKTAFSAIQIGELMFQRGAQAPEMGSEGAELSRCPGRCGYHGCVPQTRSHRHRCSPEPRSFVGDGTSTHQSRWSVTHRLLLGSGTSRRWQSFPFPRQQSCCPRSEGCRGASPPPCTPAPRFPPALAAHLCLLRCLYSLQLMKIFIILLAAAVEEVRICISTANHAAQTEPVTQQC